MRRSHMCKTNMNNSDLGHLRALMVAYFPIGVIKLILTLLGSLSLPLQHRIINGCHAAGITAVSMDKGCGITIVINHLT